MQFQDNVRSISIGHEGLNSKVERLNGTMRDRETVMRGLDKWSRSPGVVGCYANSLQFHKATPSVGRADTCSSSRHQFEFRRKQGRGFDGGYVPAINKKPEMFATELGIRVNKIEIIHDNGSVKIKPKQWLDKKTWREINDILRIQDSKWFADGKENLG